MENTNEMVRDELGHAKRSSAQDGKVGKGTLGKFVVRILNSDLAGDIQKDLRGSFDGKELIVTAAVTKALKQHIWDNPLQYRGRTIVFKYQDHGSKDLPRIPIFKGFRED
jgi:hypothetical protein